MIQDIAPHRFDRSFSRAAASPADFVLCCGEDDVLLRPEGEGYALPRFAELGLDGAGARHIFALDGTGCYLAAMPGEILDGYEAVSLRQLRQVRPMETAFAAATAIQLRHWYRDRSFCGRCGHSMDAGTTERSMVCPRCGLTEYPKLCPAVIVALTDGDRLLLTRYAGRPYRGDALIAGFVEIGETVEDTVHREVMEEVGLRVKNLRYYKSQPWAFTDTLLMGFYCELDGDDAITLDTGELREGFWQRRGEITPRNADVSLTAEMIERFRLGKEKNI